MADPDVVWTELAESKFVTSDEDEGTSFPAYVTNPVSTGGLTSWAGTSWGSGVITAGANTLMGVDPRQLSASTQVVLLRVGFGQSTETRDPVDSIREAIMSRITEALASASAVSRHRVLEILETLEDDAFAAITLKPDPQHVPSDWLTSLQGSRAREPAESLESWYERYD